MNTISQSVLNDFHQAVGRTVRPELRDSGSIELWSRIVRLERKQARRYTRRVWSKADIQAYITRHAEEAATQGTALILNTLTTSHLYHLTDARGRRTTTMGEIDFATYAPDSIDRSPSLEPSSTLVIRSISLHPSLRRKGFFTTLERQLASHGIKHLVLECVANPSWAYALYQKSLVSEEVELITGAKTVNFENVLSPVPSFALRLEACARA